MSTPAIDEIEKVSLELVALVEQSERVLRFRVSDPLIYPAHPPFELRFDDPYSFIGDTEMEDVVLRISSSRADIPKAYSLFEFVSKSAVPTEGRSYQVEVRSAGEHRVLFGAYAESVRAKVVARTLSIIAV